VPHAQIGAYDDMWGTNVNVMAAAADDWGKATLTLRPGSHYAIGTWAMLPDRSWGCAEPVEVDTNDPSLPTVLQLNHHESNCNQFRKTPAKAN